MIKNIFFDMDGTLLPMDTESFVKLYFKAISQTVAEYNITPEILSGAIWKGTEAMIRNDGTQRNEERFWNVFAEGIGKEKTEAMKPILERFYDEGFLQTKAATSNTPKAKELIEYLKAKGYRLALATNPVFPCTAQQHRIAWAGCCERDFEWITSYENSHFCKPNPAYYQEILDRLEMKAEETLMIGNDAVEDLAATALGIRAFILTDCLLHGENVDLTPYPHGSYDDLFEYIKTLA